MDFESETFVTFALQHVQIGRKEDAGPQGKGWQQDVAFTLDSRPCADAIAFDCKASGQNGFGVGSVASTLRSMGHANSHQNGGGHQAVCFDMRGREGGSQLEGPHDTANIRAADGGSSRSYVASSMQVRRLTPRECERLQGFPDDYCLIPYGQASKAKLDIDFLKYQLRGNPKHLSREDIDRLAKDGPRYKALGNSMAVPVMRWIGERIDAVSRIAAIPKREVA
jgi:DNA (cytosine-5)-methyltransferase 1